MGTANTAPPRLGAATCVAASCFPDQLGAKEANAGAKPPSRAAGGCMSLPSSLLVRQARSSGPGPILSQRSIAAGLGTRTPVWTRGGVRVATEGARRRSPEDTPPADARCCYSSSEIGWHGR